MNFIRYKNILLNLDQVETICFTQEQAEVTFVSGRVSTIGVKKLVKKLNRLKKSWIARLLRR